MDKILDSLQFLRKRLHFLDGLFVLIIISEIIYSMAGKTVGHHIVMLLNSTDHPTVLEYCRALFVLGFLVIPLVAWLVWRSLRAVPRFEKDELAVLFAPNASPETQEVMDRLFIHLKQEIESCEFGVRFSIKKLPPNLSIDSAQEATTILRAARAVVAVWGPVEQQQSKHGKKTGFSRLSVTFVHRPARLHPRRHEALALSLFERQLHVRERTQIADQRIVAKDIGIIVRNVIGVALSINRRFAEASSILGLLHLELKDAFPKKPSTPVQRFRKQVQYDYAYSLTMTTSDEYDPWLFNGNLSEIPEETLAKWIKNVQKAASLDSQNSNHYLFEAIYLFLSGDIQGAIRAEKKADQLAPRAVAVANLGLAFLYNFTGDFRRSRDQYRLGLAKKTSYDEGMIDQCLRFISQSIEQFPDKKQLHLAQGVLQYHRGSVSEARRSLKALLDDPPTAPELQDFVEEAKKLMEKATEQEEDDQSTA